MMVAKIFKQSEIEAMLIDVGMKPKIAMVGAAIALCEAPGGNKDDEPCADFGLIGDRDLVTDVWGPSFGGFQIRSLRAQKGTGGVRDATKLVDPEFNCRSARTIRLDNNGWTPWSTYNSGMYKAYLQDIFPPPPNTYVVVAGDTLGSIASSLSIDWQELARINGLHEPWTIYIGQYLTLP